MTGWGRKLVISLVGGLLLFAVLLIPLLINQYRRYGRLSPRRIGATSLGCVYAVALVAYTLLPLPDSTANCGPFGNVSLQFVPFMFVRYIQNEAVGNTFFGVLISISMLQAVLNVALFVPFGLFVRGVLRRGLPVTVVLGFIASLIIEVTQGTRLWGLYDCRYRVADVDDLILNTTGALLGALVAPRLLSWLPRPERLARGRLRPRPVTLLRRWLGMIIDLAVFTGLSALFTLAAAAVNWLLGIELTGAAQHLIGLPTVIAGLISFGVPAVAGSGASIGQRAIWLAPSWPDGSSRARRLLRAGVVSGSWTLGVALSLSVDRTSVLQLVAVLLTLPGLAAPVSVLFTRGRRGLSCWVAGAELTDSRAEAPGLPDLTEHEAHV